MDDCPTTEQRCDRQVHILKSNEAVQYHFSTTPPTGCLADIHVYIVVIVQLNAKQCNGMYTQRTEEELTKRGDKHMAAYLGDLDLDLDLETDRCL